MLYRVHLAMNGVELPTLVVIGTDCIGSHKSNYRTIMTMMAPNINLKPILQALPCQHHKHICMVIPCFSVWHVYCPVMSRLSQNSAVVER